MYSSNIIIKGETHKKFYKNKSNSHSLLYYGYSYQILPSFDSAKFIHCKTIVIHLFKDRETLVKSSGLYIILCG